jgi:hypothetical protein
MSIDKSGKWWVGNDPQDIGEFLAAYSADAYPTHEFRISKCTCGSIRFKLEADDNEGTARRTCAACGREHFICDSEEYWEDSEPEALNCIECNSQQANIGVGFSLYPDDAEVKWLYVGYRCADCGVLGCFAGWKVAYAPSRHLFDKV